MYFASFWYCGGFYDEQSFLFAFSFLGRNILLNTKMRQSTFNIILWRLLFSIIQIPI